VKGKVVKGAEVPSHDTFLLTFE